MVLIIKKFVPVYSEQDNVPKKFKNLRKSKYVATFKFWYPNIPEILVNEYGIKSDEKILVFSMKEISLPHFSRYRTKFRKIYYGPLESFTKFLNNLRSKIKVNPSLNKQVNNLNPYDKQFKF